MHARTFPIHANTFPLPLSTFTNPSRTCAETSCSLQFAARVSKVELGAAKKRGDGGAAAILKEADGKVQVATMQVRRGEGLCNVLNRRNDVFWLCLLMSTRVKKTLLGCTHVLRDERMLDGVTERSCKNQHSFCD